MTDILGSSKGVRYVSHVDHPSGINRLSGLRFVGQQSCQDIPTRLKSHLPALQSAGAKRLEKLPALWTDSIEKEIQNEKC